MTPVQELWSKQPKTYRRYKPRGLVGVEPALGAGKGVKIKRLGGSSEVRGAGSTHSIGRVVGVSGEYAGQIIATGLRNILRDLAASERSNAGCAEGEVLDWYAELRANPGLLGDAFEVCRARDDLRRLERLDSEGRLLIVDSGTESEGFCSGICVVTDHPSEHTGSLENTEGHDLHPLGGSAGDAPVDCESTRRESTTGAPTGAVCAGEIAEETGTAGE